MIITNVFIIQNDTWWQISMFKNFSSFFVFYFYKGIFYKFKKKECFELKKFMEYMLDGKQTQNVMHGENILIMSKMFYYPIRETVTYFHSTSHRTLLVPQSHLNYIA